MPTDLSHLVAFLVTLSVIGLIGVGAFVYIWLTTRPSTDQRTFDFPPAGGQETLSKKIKAPPLARV